MPVDKVGRVRDALLASGDLLMPCASDSAAARRTIACSDLVCRPTTFVRSGGVRTTFDRTSRKPQRDQPRGPSSLAAETAAKTHRQGWPGDASRAGSRRRSPGRRAGQSTIVTLQSAARIGRDERLQSASHFEFGRRSHVPRIGTSGAAAGVTPQGGARARRSRRPGG